MSTRRIALRNVNLVMLACCIACSAISSHIGCATGKPPRSADVRTDPHVPIGAIGGGLLAEHLELNKLLLDNGVSVAFDGTSVLDIMVPKSQVRRAVQILKTNHLVLEKKVWLSEPWK